MIDHKKKKLVTNVIIFRNTKSPYIPINISIDTNKDKLSQGN